MGRITVFTRSDDLNSKQILKELERRGLPYEEIDLTAHPSKIDDLNALVDAPSVPHVFFNTRHVGGLHDCRDELVKNWDRPSNRRYKTALEKFRAEIAAGFDPTNENLALLPLGSKRAPQEVPAIARRVRVYVELPDGSRMYVREMTECLKVWVARGSHVYQGKHYKRSFTGRKLAVSLQEALGLQWDQACGCAKALMEKHGLVKHVDPARILFVGADEEVYRLACEAAPEVLNSYLSWPPDVPQPDDCLTLVDNLQRLLNVMEFSSTDPEDGLLNVPHCLKLKKFPKFEEALCELQHVSSTELTLLTQEEMTAFALNLYHVLVRYANLKIGIPVTEADRQDWLQYVKFNLAGETFTLQDWVDILLNKTAFMDSGNGNHSHNSGGFLQYNSLTDDSISNSSDHFGVRADTRTHFCLLLGPYCGGSQWSAPFSRFSPDHLEEQLEIAARLFCQEDRFVRVNRQENTLELVSSVFKFHYKDFCRKEHGLPKAILPYLSGNKLLELSAMIKQGRGSKAIQIVYVEPPLGTYTIDGPWYKKTQNTSKARTVLIRRGSMANKSIRKAMAAKQQRLSSLGTVSTHPVSEHGSVSEHCDD